MPHGVPDFVPPSSDKLDLKRLRDDIPKFFNSRCVEEKHKKWWTDFLDDKDGLFNNPEKATTWLLDDIIVKKQRQEVNSSSEWPQELVNVLHIPRPPNAQPEIEQLVVGQIDEIPTVSKKECNSCDCFGIPMYIHNAIPDNRINKFTVCKAAAKKYDTY